MIIYPCVKISAIASAVALILLSYPSAAAHDPLIALRNGTPPTLGDPDFQSRRARLLGRSRDLAAEWKDQRVSDSERCRRFTALYSDLLQTVAVNLAGSPLPSLPAQNLTAGEWWARTKLLLLLPGLSAMHDLLDAGAEGGFTTFGSELRVNCAFKDRPGLLAKSESHLRDLSSFYREGAGGPGLAGVDAMIDHLLTTAIEEERSRRNTSAAVIGGVTVASIVLWEAAPALSLYFTQSAGIGSAWASSPWLLFATRSSAFAAESVIYDQVQSGLVPPALEPKLNATASWEEQIRAIEQLPPLQPYSADVAFAMLSAVQNQIASLLPQDGDPLVAEARLSNGLTIPRASDELSASLFERYRFRIGCATGTLSGLTDTECLLGLRRLARQLYTAKPAKLDATASHVLTITLDDLNEPAMGRTDTNYEIRLPYSLRNVTAVDYLNSVTASRSFAQMGIERERLQGLTDGVQTNLGMKIEFDPALTTRDRWRTLLYLQSLAKTNNFLLDREADRLIIGLRFRRLNDEGMRATEEIDGRSSLENIRLFLADADKRNRVLARRFRSNQAALESLQERMQKDYGIAIQCSRSGILTSRDCLNGATAIRDYLENNAGKTVGFGAVLITDPYESERSVDAIPGAKNILIVHHDFNPADLQGLTL